jgi:hypothetical protein|tara:strand:- start:185 stop:349 length:165 start_codon:yes stop_codon:yes gene_type:complete
MTKQDAEKLGWKFSQCETTIEKGHEIYMLPNKETALVVIAKREANFSMGIVRKD